jgi:acyl carrier protein
MVALVCETGQLGQLSPDEDFYDAGFSSLNSLQLLMRLESDWDVSIPDEEFITARSARALEQLVTRLKDGARCA